MKTAIKMLMTAALAAGLLAACASPSTDLAGTSWTLTSLDGSTQVGEAAGGRPMTIEFDSEGRAGGSAGCNGYGADYSLTAEDISFGPAVSTLMACEPQLVMENEAAFLQALGEISSYAISGNTLTLTGGGHALVFAR